MARAVTDEASDDDRAFRVAAGVESAVVAGELCLLASEQSQLIVLNESAQAVWQLASSGADLEEMVAHFAGLSGSDPEVVREGVRAILDQLEQNHLLVRRP